MKNFENYLTESTLSTGNLKKAKKLILSFLKKKLGQSWFAFAGLEKWKSSNGTGVGLRFYNGDDLKSVRFNWDSSNGDENTLRSIHVWNGKTREPNIFLEFESIVSVARVLKMAVNILSGEYEPERGSFRLPKLSDSLNEDADLNELFSSQEYLQEKNNFDMDDAFEKILQMFKDEEKVSENEVWKVFKGGGVKIFNAMINNFPDTFEKQGNRKVYILQGNIGDIRNEKDGILDSLESAKGKVRKGAKESYEPDDETERVEQEKERIVFEEQLDDLENLVKLVSSGASNAMFVAGRGGCLSGDTKLPLVEKGNIKLSEIRDQVKEQYENIEYDKFYDIQSLNLYIDTPDEKAKAVSFVVKEGYPAKVTMKNGVVVSCSTSHLLKTPEGSLSVSNLKEGDEIIGKTFLTTISSIEIANEKDDFYDIEVDNNSHLYYTSDGVCHHNTGKTFTIEKTLEDFGLRQNTDWFEISGSVSAVGMYTFLFKHKSEIIVFDDADDVFKDQTSRNIIKGATDTKEVRELNWLKGGGNVVDEEDFESPDDLLDAAKIPRKFEFTGQIIFISNLKINKLDPDGALRTRGFLIEIDPTNEEIFDLMDKIVENVKLPDGLSLSNEQRHKTIDMLRATGKGSADLRKMVRALKMKAGGESADVEDEKLKRLMSRYA